MVYVLEVNPRASRTVPFVSKATGMPWAKMAAKVMAGKTLAELGRQGEVVPAGPVLREGIGVALLTVSPAWTRSWARR